MCWNRERLQYYLEANPKLEKAMQLIRGRDVLNKVNKDISLYNISKDFTAFKLS